MSRGAVLEMQGITKRYRAGIRGCSATALALENADLTVRAGERVGVLGAPGSGKTTLLLCAAGLARPDDGVVRWRGRARLAERRGIALVDDREALYAFLTVRETLDHHLRALLPAHERESRIGRALDACDLNAVAGCRISLLPPGARRRTALAQALLFDPWLLLLDGTADPLPRADAGTVRAALAAVASRGCAIVVSSRDPGALSGIATRIVELRAPRSSGNAAQHSGAAVSPVRIALVRERDDTERR